MKHEAEKISQERSNILDFPEEEKQKLFEMIGLGSLKYFLLKVTPKSRMLFNPEESVKLHGDTAPYIQYTHARICSILRKSPLTPRGGIHTDKAIILLNPSEIAKIEIDLIYLLSEYPNAIAAAGREYSPSVICQYVYDLSKTYNTFYNEIKIIAEPDESKLLFRIGISKAVSETIAKAMLLLGIEVPIQM
jgi:arginyl-tRNA synthetase